MSRPNSSPQVAGVESGVESVSLSNIGVQILGYLKKKNLSKSELALQFGKPKPNRYFHELVRDMLFQGLIEYTRPDKPNSRFQRYSLTQKGMGHLPLKSLVM